MPSRFLLELAEIVKVGASIQGRKRSTLGGEKFNLVREKIYGGAEYAKKNRPRMNTD
jgi:hypothetical protein